MKQVIKFLAKNCSPELPEKEPILKIKAAYEKYLLKERSLAKEIRDWVSVTCGDFNVTELAKEHGIVTSRNKANRQKIIQRLVEQNIVQRASRRESWYRRIEAGAPRIDWQILT